MAFRIEVYSTIEDARVQVQLLKWRHFPFEKKIRKLVIAQKYTIDKKFTKEQKLAIGKSLTNPLVEKFYIYSAKDSSGYPAADWQIEVGFLPGVTDNIARTVKEIIEDLTKKKFSFEEGVYSSKTYLLDGQLIFPQINLLAGSLSNSLIESIRINDLSLSVPKVRLKRRGKVRKINLNKSAQKLKKLSESGNLFLTVRELGAIRDYFDRLKRKPTDIELESLAQNWSEHCRHKIFNSPIGGIKEGLFQHYIARTTRQIRRRKGKNDKCVSVFKDNSGAFEFDENYLITHKVETHNSPSALDPYGGAITGIVGVNRDTLGFGLGAQPIANIYGFCFAPPFRDGQIYRDKGRQENLLSARRILDGVVEGVNNGGNQSGIPTVQGFIFFHESYRGKPLVFVGTVGILPKNNKMRLLDRKKAQKGDFIVMVGGKVGKDGIHGATFSSGRLSAYSPVSAVQIGDPITQKKMSDVIVKEARDLNLYHSITDNGAGGLSCSVTEMARESGGCQVNLDDVPLKYAGLDPWEIWVSESQERMTLAVPPNKWPIFKKLMQLRGVEAWKIGKFTASGKCLVFQNDQKIMDIRLDFLHDGWPKEEKQIKKPRRPVGRTDTNIRGDFSKILIAMLKDPNMASYRFISEQFDHTVQAHLALPPLSGKGRVNAQTSAITPYLGSKKGLVFSSGYYPSYSLIDAYKMAANSLDRAVANVVAAGADPGQVYLLDNFCWSQSDKAERLYQLEESLKGLRQTALVYKTPFISGKDSMYNDFSGFDEKGLTLKISVLPTLLISAIAVTPDVANLVSLDFKSNNDLIYLLGATDPNLGGSEFLKVATGKYESGDVPSVNPARNMRLYRQYFKASRKNLIASAIALNKGGLGVALAYSSLAGETGFEINLPKLPNIKDKEILFSQSGGRILVSVDKKNRHNFESFFKGLPLFLLGKTTVQKRLVVKNSGHKKIIDLPLSDCQEAYIKVFKEF